MRRKSGQVMREPTGRWTISADHLHRIATSQLARIMDRSGPDFWCTAART
jgi:hypothetical protein